MPVFVASDGTKFEDRAAWRRYEFETNYTFRNKKSEKLIKLPGKISGQPFDLSDLDQCEVILLDQCDQVQVDNLTNCHVFIGPCSESVFVRNCSNCTFTIACKQLRTRDCTDCTFGLYSLTDPIIETSSDMKFALFNGAYPGIHQHFADARLEPTNNHWSLVYDFNDPDKSGVNWSLLKPEEAGGDWVINLADQVPDAAALGPCTNPVPKDAGYIQYDESGSKSTGGMQSFSFQTSQQEAEKILAVAPAPVADAAPVSAPPPPMPVPTSDQAALPLPPPAPMQSTMTENQKVAVVEAAELLAPPPSAGGCCGIKNASEPAIDVAVASIASKLDETVTLGMAPSTST